jgi:site-specific recombinase XerD
MSTQKLTSTTSNTTTLSPYTESVHEYIQQAKSTNTRRIYQTMWREFEAFAKDQNTLAMPATSALVIEYIAALANKGAKISTIGVKLAAIAFAHRTAKQPDPTVDEKVKLVMTGIRRSKGVPPAKKAPIADEEIKALISALPATLVAKRDRALILVGYAGAFRRSELVGLNVDDLRSVRGDIKITLKHSKTDQENQGLTKVIPLLDDKTLCPVTALRAWLDTAKIKSGPVFRQIDQYGHVRSAALTPQSVALIIKAAATRAKLDPRQFAGHSLRSGFVTQAHIAGADTIDIMQQTGHKNIRTLRGYIQDAGIGAQRAARAAVGK